tara:strand:+ start:2452 stop:2655 length:204 start_codon:yes stop_codon:yes gene_type:complete
MDIKAFNERATKLNEDFVALRWEMKMHVLANRDEVRLVDETAPKKFNNYLSDITPARLVSLSKKLLP